MAAGLKGYSSISGRYSLGSITYLACAAFRKKPSALFFFDAVLRPQGKGAVIGRDNIVQDIRVFFYVSARKDPQDIDCLISSPAVQIQVTDDIPAEVYDMS